MGPDGDGAIRRARKSRVQEKRTGTPAPIGSVDRRRARRLPIVEDGDVVIAYGVAGIWRGGPGLESPTMLTMAEYRLSVRGHAHNNEQVFTLYDHAIAGGDALAATLQVRLFYADGTALTLLKDYRPAARA
jgi:hypothetical protein